MSQMPALNLVPSIPEGTTAPHSPERKQADLESSSKEGRAGASDAAHGYNGHAQDNDSSSTLQEEAADEGVTRIEALYLVFGKGWKLWMLWGSIALISYVFSLSNATTYSFLPFATSAFNTHSLLGTIGVINSLIAAISQPFIAKICDLVSRPFALTGAVVLYALGFIVVAASKSVTDVAGGEVLYTMGNTGLQLVQLIIMADLTNMRNRGWVVGALSLPWIVNVFISAQIITGISGYTADGWRWGYGMFVILVPVCIAPALVVLFWGDRKAKKLGALSIASSAYARKRLLNQRVEHTSIWRQGVYYLQRINALGLILMGFSFALILLPFTLVYNAENGYKNPSLIAMFVVGGVLFIVFCLHEWKMAKYPIMPRRVLNRTLLCAIVIDFLYYLSYYISGDYWLSWVYIVKNEWSDRNYAMYSNTLTVGLCLGAFVGGLIQRWTKQYKWIQLVGLSIRIIGQGLQFACYKNPSDAFIVTSTVLISIGGGFSVTSSQVAAQISVPHQDMALAISLLALWTQVGGGVGRAIGAAIWTSTLPRKLEEYAGASLNSTQLAQVYGTITVARVAEPREQVLQAYLDTGYYIFLPALIFTILPLIAGFLTVDFRLDDRHNAIESKQQNMLSEDETTEDVIRQRVAQAEEKARRDVGLVH